METIFSLQLHATATVLGIAGFLWLVVEAGSYFRDLLKLQENKLFWWLWASLWAVLLLAAIVADLLLAIVGYVLLH